MCPIALVNAYYYLHGKYPFDCSSRYPQSQINTLAERCKTTCENGTRPSRMKLIRIVKLGIPVRMRYKIMEMKQFILLYSLRYEGEFGAHYVFVVKKDNRYHVYNGCHRGTNLTPSEFYRNYLSYNPMCNADYDEGNSYTEWACEMEFPIAWEVSKLKRVGKSKVKKFFICLVVFLILIIDVSLCRFQSILII